MKCHNVLGISERASEEEILLAYAHKIAEVEKNIDVAPTILDRKRQELNSAKEDCLTWRDKSSPSRILSRVSEFSSQVTSPNTVNECCIGPCSGCNMGYYVSCCGADWGSEETTALAICCDLMIYAGIGVAIFQLKSKAEIEQKQAEERAAAERKQAEERAAVERERAVKLQSSEQECRSILKNMLTSLSVDTAKNALGYITEKPENVPQRDAVNREFAIREAKQYIGSIDNACMEAIYNHRLEDSAQYLKLLEILNPGDKKYKVLMNSINTVMKYLNAQTPYIITAKYGEVNTTLFNELSLIHAGASLSIDCHDLQSLVWGMALNEPFDAYSYRTFIEQLSSLGMAIDTVSSLIYVDSKYGRSIVEKVRKSYWNDLCSFISKSSPSTIRSLASISAWCGNLNVERLALDKLNKKQILSGKLRERYELIQNQ